MRSLASRLSVVAASLGSNLRDVARASREMGFSGLQFESKLGTLDLVSLSGSGRREFIHILSSQDRKLVGLRAALGQKGLGPAADLDRELDRLGALMETAASLAAPLVCVDVGPLPEPPAAPRSRPAVSAQQAGLILLPSMIAEAPAEAAPLPPTAADRALADSVRDAMAELGRRADRYGVLMAIRSEFSSFAAIQKILADANCSWFGLDLDPVAVLRDAWNFDEVLSRLGNDVRHVIGRDAVSGTGGRVIPTVVGGGQTHWPELLANLDAAGYSGWITVDPADLPDRIAACATAISLFKTF